MTEYTVTAFYKFADLPDFESRRSSLMACAQANDVLGTILLAREGVNGTIAGTQDGVNAVIDHIRSFPGCDDMEWKTSIAQDPPFHRMKVRLKKEIVTLGVPDLAPHLSHERYVPPEDWNTLISDPETLVIDTRNDYEVSIGTFEGAINPETPSFRDFPKWFREFRKNRDVKKVAMFCTGGIRCEKSVAYLRSEGIEDVAHLQGGILKYLETIPEDESLWRGECFVFDERVSVGHDLLPGSYDMCHACRMPIDENDKASPHYRPGVSCPHCINLTTEEQRKGFAERQKQMELAKARGEIHIGVKTGGGR